MKKTDNRNVFLEHHTQACYYIWLLAFICFYHQRTTVHVVLSYIIVGAKVPTNKKWCKWWKCWAKWTNRWKLMQTKMLHIVSVEHCSNLKWVVIIANCMRYHKPFLSVAQYTVSNVCLESCHPIIKIHMISIWQ